MTLRRPSSTMASTIQGRSLGAIDRVTLGALEAELKDLNLRGLAQDPRLSGPQRAAVEQATGNQNGVLFDEAKPTPGWQRNVVAQYGQAAAGVGLSRRDEERFIQDVMGALEARWGQPISHLPIDAVPKRGLEMLIRKASQLQRLGLEPSQVTDVVLKASGAVHGVATKPQRIFAQRFRPSADKDLGKVVVLSPGFQETGRSFEAQIAEMLDRGYNVVAMDHQWSGHSDGEAGSFDRAEGLARNVAATCAYAQGIVEQEYQGKEGAEALLFGNSMGGMAALFAKAMNDHGQVELGPLTATFGADGPQPIKSQMPRAMKLMLQAPFLGLSDGLLNKALAFSGRIPMINSLKLPSNGIAPKISSDRDVAVYNAQQGLLEHIKASPVAMHRGLEGIETLNAFMKDHVPQGDVAIYHQRGDTLAKHSESQRFADFLKARRGAEGVEMHSAEGVDHVVQNDPDVFKDPLAVLDRLAQGQAGR